MTGRGNTAAGRLADALDRDDLAWFAQHPDTSTRIRTTRPAERRHTGEVFGTPARRVTVTRLGTRMLSRTYDNGGHVLAIVGNVWEVSA